MKKKSKFLFKTICIVWAVQVMLVVITIITTFPPSKEIPWNIHQLAVRQHNQNEWCFVRIINEHRPLYDATGKRVIKNKWYKQYRNCVLVPIEEQPVLCAFNSSSGALVRSQIVIKDPGFPLQTANADIYID